MMLVDHKTKITILIVFLVALFLRMAVIMLHPLDLRNIRFGYSEDISHFANDEGTFHFYAKSILEKGIFSYDGVTPGVWKPPLYPGFLALLYFIFNENYFLIRAIQALMSAFLCIIVFLIGKRCFSTSVGVIASALLAVNINFVYMPDALMSENILTFFLTFAIFFLTKTWEKPVFKNLAMSGFCFGLAALTRAEVLLLPPFIFIAMLLKDKLNKNCFVKNARNFLVILFCFMLPVIAWTIRNYKAFNRFIPVCSEAGIELYASYCPPNGKTFGSVPYDDIVKQSEELPESERDTYLIKKTVEFITSNPSRVIKLTMLKILFLFSPFEYELTGGEKGVYNASFVFAFPFFIFGFFILRKRWLELLPIMVPIAYYFLLAIILYGCSRWRSCVEPLMMVFSAAGIIAFTRISAKRLVLYLLLFVLILMNIIVYIFADYVKIEICYILQQLGLW